MPRSMTQQEIEDFRKAFMLPENEPAAARKPLTRAGEGGHRAGAGFLNDIFNIWDQPKSAVTTAVKYGTDKGDNADKTNFITGFVRGLTGKEHTSTADIMRENFGVTNPIALGLGGFIGDVAADPLTYFSMERIPGTTPGAAKLSAVQDIAKAVGEGTISRADAPAKILQLASQKVADNPYRMQLNIGLPWKM